MQHQYLCTMTPFNHGQNDHPQLPHPLPTLACPLGDYPTTNMVQRHQDHGHRICLHLQTLTIMAMDVHSLTKGRARHH